MKAKITKEGMVVYDPLTYTTFQFNRAETEKLLNIKFDFDKLDYHCRIVHMELSNRCDMDCPECYNQEKNKGQELPPKKWKKIIDKLNDYGIFQCTIGGGEPTLYPGLIEVARYCNQLKIPVAMTTNGKYLNNIPQERAVYFAKINVSWHGNKYIFEQALNYLSKANIQIGVNYTVSKQTLKDYEYIVDSATKYNAEILFLSYKPVLGDWNNHVPITRIMKLAKRTYKKWKLVAVDGLVCESCAGAKYFIDINSMGIVYPCSFIRTPIGDLNKQTFKEIWANRPKQIECPYKKDGDILPALKYGASS